MLNLILYYNIYKKDSAIKWETLKILKLFSTHTKIMKKFKEFLKIQYL